MEHVFVLYDRSTDSVWYPMSDSTLDAVAGEWHGRSIPFVAKPAPTPLGAWLDMHPDSEILLPTDEDLERLERRRNRPYLGVRLGERDGAVVLESVVEDGPAGEADLEDGDVVSSIAGVPIESRRDLRGVMRDHAPGDVVEVVVERAGREVRVQVTLGKAPTQ
jgi:membrane-associated protease RseP (regulator of RpoE activity)